MANGVTLKHLFKKLRIFFFATLLTTFSFSASAQGGQQEDIFAQSMQDMWIVVGTTAGGAILGLSTLSFVDEPSEHLKNIVVGGAIGVIVGVGIVAYKQANVSKDLYKGTFNPSETPEMTTSQRMAWHTKNHYQINSNLGNQTSQNTQAVNFQFSF